MKKAAGKTKLIPLRYRRDLEREIWETAHGGSEAFNRRFEAVVRPMVEQMNSGDGARMDDLDRFVSLTLFFEAAELVRAGSPEQLASLGDEAIKQIAMCLGLDPNWSTEIHRNGKGM